MTNRPFFWPLFVELPIAASISFMPPLNSSAALYIFRRLPRAIRHQYIRQHDGTAVEASLVSTRIPPEPAKPATTPCITGFANLIGRYPNDNDSLQSETLDGELSNARYAAPSIRQRLTLQAVDEIFRSAAQHAILAINQAECEAR